ncbi:hypothetical protein C7974DRAFT_140029 [Boeremia exigua]|uniref:uncharacterized protein n=1 Tax=Boeremia exigua TaxID=749465 RepID=UPI001E8E4CD7|nr:uncharacterized protein C7974DRAFT_140029 [Boeremia exigua]KAH6639872.1 hypothetical protein C7974DRAFT_140029 [Boeremia exigua]
MYVSYFMEGLMGLIALMVAAVYVGENQVVTAHDLALLMLQTSYVPVTRFLAVVLIILLAMRSTTLLATSARQILAIGRSCNMKELNFLGELDGSPAPRSALSFVAVMTAVTELLTLLKDYRLVFEQVRRLGVLCTLTSHIICIGAVCIYRLRDLTNRNKTRPRFSYSKVLRFITSWLAFGACVSFLIFVNFPPELPVKPANAPWSLLVWGLIIMWLSFCYWNSACVDFGIEKVPGSFPGFSTDMLLRSVNNTTSAAAEPIRPHDPEPHDAIRSQEALGNDQLNYHQTAPMPGWLHEGPVDHEQPTNLEMLNTLGPITQPKTRNSHRPEIPAHIPDTLACLAPSRCLQGARIPGAWISDIGPSDFARGLCRNCKASRQRAAVMEDGWPSRADVFESAYESA